MNTGQNYKAKLVIAKAYRLCGTHPTRVAPTHYAKQLSLGPTMEKFKTRGLDSDQTVAAIIATQKMLNVE
jgi:hypothetical protein